MAEGTATATPTQTATPDIQKALADPEFLKLGPDDQVSVLKHLSSLPSPAATPQTAEQPPGSLPAPPSAAGPSTGLGETYKKLGRGAALGAFSGLGVEPENATESSSGGQVALGVLRHTLEGMGTAADAIIHDPIEGTYKVVDNMASQLENSLRESWTGLKDRDPEQFAHGLGSALTQAITLGSAGKGEAAKAPGARTRMAKVAKSIEAGGEQAADLKTAMPVIVDTAKGAGLKTVGEFGNAVSKAHSLVEQRFNRAMALIANMPYVPTEVAQRIRGLITPDMAKTAEGRTQIKEINAAARDYDGRPWTIRELNAKRMTENDNLRQFYGKDTRGQAASKLQTDISRTVADATRDIVYEQISKANPGLDARALKAQQGALWALDDYINHPKRGVIADLEAKQLQHEGESRVEKLTTGASVGRTGVPHGYIGGLSNMFSEGPMKAANAKVRGGFEPSFTRKAAKAWALSLPLNQLMRTPQRPGSLPLPPSADDEE